MENSLERTEKKQCGPWAELCIADGGIEGRRRPDLPGKGGGVVLAHLGFDFGAWTGRRKCRRWGTAEPWISGRERHCSDVDAHCGGSSRGLGSSGGCLWRWRLAYGPVAVSERGSSAGVQQWRPVLCKAGAAAGRKENDDGLASHKKRTTSRRARGRTGRRQGNCQLASCMRAGRATSACVGACS
jgi:hypothetical protein